MSQLNVNIVCFFSPRLPLSFALCLYLHLCSTEHTTAPGPPIFVRSSETKHQQNNGRALHIPHRHFFIVPFHLLNCLSKQTMPTGGMYLMWGRMVTGMLKRNNIKARAEWDSGIISGFVARL